MKKIINHFFKKYNYWFKTKKFRDFKQFLDGGLTLEEWKVVEETKEYADYQKSKGKNSRKNFRTRTFSELSTRKQREQRNKIKKDIKNGYYATHHLDEVDMEHSWMDLYFLSKKDKNKFYNVTVVSSTDNSYQELEEYFFDKDRDYRFNQQKEDPKQKINKKLIFEFSEPNKFIFLKDYSFGIGLEIVINNGKKTFTQQDIIKAIEFFWKNEEKEYIEKVKKAEQEKRNLVALKNILLHFTSYKMIKELNVFYKEKINEFYKELLDNGEISQIQYEAGMNLVVCKNLQERKENNKLRNEFYEIVNQKESKILKMLDNFKEKEIYLIKIKDENNPDIFVNKEPSEFLINFIEQALNQLSNYNNISCNKDDVDIDKLFEFIHKNSKDYLFKEIKKLNI